MYLLIAGAVLFVCCLVDDDLLFWMFSWVVCCVFVIVLSISIVSCCWVYCLAIIMLFECFILYLTFVCLLFLIIICLVWIVCFVSLIGLFVGFVFLCLLYVRGLGGLVLVGIWVLTCYVGFVLFFWFGWIVCLLPWFIVLLCYLLWFACFAVWFACRLVGCDFCLFWVLVWFSCLKLDLLICFGVGFVCLLFVVLGLCVGL